MQIANRRGCQAHLVSRAAPMLVLCQTHLLPPAPFFAPLLFRNCLLSQAGESAIELGVKVEIGLVGIEISQ